jgi:hypothetical protein
MDKIRGLDDNINCIRLLKSLSCTRNNNKSTRILTLHTYMAAISLGETVPTTDQQEY